MKTPLSFQKLLFAFFAFIAVMLLVRFIYSGKYAFVFLIWNLFLAWIPFTISAIFEKYANKSKWKQLVIFFTWLLFFPNALYIVTDLIHLNMDSSVPKWFDAVLLFTSSIVGLMMAFVSLLRAEKYLSRFFNKRFTDVIVFAILFLGSFGVYLGRFLRWNSWDIISNPFGLFISIAERIVFPFKYVQTWGITALFTTLFYLLYLSIQKMPGGVTTASSRQTP